jgi:hypothetical protein
MCRSGDHAKDGERASADHRRIAILLRFYRCLLGRVMCGSTGIRISGCACRIVGAQLRLGGWIGTSSQQPLRRNDCDYTCH